MKLAFLMVIWYDFGCTQLEFKKQNILFSKHLKNINLYSFVANKASYFMLHILLK